MEIGEKVEIVVPGDPNQVCTCITSEARPFASHCWIRAAYHTLKMNEFEYFVRFAAYTTCYQMAEVVSKNTRRPQRIEAIPGFSWDNFKTITPIK